MFLIIMCIFTCGACPCMYTMLTKLISKKLMSLVARKQSKNSDSVPLVGHKYLVTVECLLWA